MSLFNQFCAEEDGIYCQQIFLSPPPKKKKKKKKSHIIDFIYYSFLWIGFFLFVTEHFHIFVGDLSPDIEQQQLREAFQPFGEIS